MAWAKSVHQTADCQHSRSFAALPELKGYVQTLSLNLFFWQFQIFYPDWVWKSLDSKINKYMFANLISFLFSFFLMKFRSNLHQSDSVQTLQLLISDFRVQSSMEGRKHWEQQPVDTEINCLFRHLTVQLFWRWDKKKIHKKKFVKFVLSPKQNQHQILNMQNPAA